MDKAELLEKLDEMKDFLGADRMLDALAKSLSADVLEDHLRYINRCYEIDINFD